MAASQGIKLWTKSLKRSITTYETRSSASVAASTLKEDSRRFHEIQHESNEAKEALKLLQFLHTRAPKSSTKTTTQFKSWNGTFNTSNGLVLDLLSSKKPSHILQRYREQQQQTSSKHPTLTLDEYQQVIEAFLQSHQNEQAVELYEQITDSTIREAPGMLECGIQAYCYLNRPTEAANLMRTLEHSHSTKHWMKLKAHIMFTYAKTGNYEASRETFEIIRKQQKQWSPRGCNYVIAGFGEMRDPQAAFDFYELMVSYGMRTSEYTISTMLKVCINNNCRSQAKLILQNIASAPISPDLALYNTMLSAYLFIGKDSKVLQLVEDMIAKQLPLNSVTREVMNKCFEHLVTDGAPDLLPVAINTMRKARWKITAKEYTIALKQLCKSPGYWREVLQVLAHAQKDQVPIKEDMIDQIWWSFLQGSEIKSIQKIFSYSAQRHIPMSKKIVQKIVEKSTSGTGGFENTLHLLERYTPEYLNDNNILRSLFQAASHQSHAILMVRAFRMWKSSPHYHPDTSILLAALDGAKVAEDREFLQEVYDEVKTHQLSTPEIEESYKEGQQVLEGILA